jgi:hypothetical protein
VSTTPGNELFTGVNDIGDEMFTGIIDTGDEMFTGVIDTSNELLSVNRCQRHQRYFIGGVVVTGQ